MAKLSPQAHRGDVKVVLVCGMCMSVGARMCGEGQKRELCAATWHMLVPVCAWGVASVSRLG